MGVYVRRYYVQKGTAGTRTNAGGNIVPLEGLDVVRKLLSRPSLGFAKKRKGYHRKGDHWEGVGEKGGRARRQTQRGNKLIRASRGYIVEQAAHYWQKVRRA